MHVEHSEVWKPLGNQKTRKDKLLAAYWKLLNYIWLQGIRNLEMVLTYLTQSVNKIHYKNECHYELKAFDQEISYYYLSYKL